MKKTRSPSKGDRVSIFVPALAVAFTVLVAQSALADGGDFQLDFTAAAPLDYDHTTGGGAYDQRAVEGIRILSNPWKAATSPVKIPSRS